MALKKRLKIGPYEFEHVIIQAGMGIGITLNKMAIASSKNGIVPVVALVGTNYYKDKKRPNVRNFNSRESMEEILAEIRAEVGDAPIFCNIMCALTEYENIVKNAIEIGFNGIISGAGLAEYLPGYIEEYAKEGQYIAIVPIVNHRAFKTLSMKWRKNYKRDIFPDALVLEGPLSGGHQGYKLKEINDPDFQLEATAPKVLEMIEKTGQNIPLLVAGGIMYQEDIRKFLDIGCSGVQIGSRFLMTEESDASDMHKQIVLDCKSPDGLEMAESPAGYISRRFVSKMTIDLKNGIKFYTNCKSNCLTNCNRGEIASELGYCIADQLGLGYQGDENGLFFGGARSWEINEIPTVKNLVIELTDGLYD